MWQSTEIRFAGDHPTAAGHFPSNPIIPGALLLDVVVEAVAGNAVSDGAVVIRVAKFLRPVRPGDGMRVQWQRLNDGAVKFECRLVDGDSLAVAGTLELDPAPP